MSYVRRSTPQTYGGPHVGTRGSLADVKYNGGEDFSEGIPYEEQLWEQLVVAAMMTHDAGFHHGWTGDCDLDDFETMQIRGVYGENYDSKQGEFTEEGLFRPLDH